jgi:hypothetical protein
MTNIILTNGFTYIFLQIPYRSVTGAGHDLKYTVKSVTIKEARFPLDF